MRPIALAAAIAGLLAANASAAVLFSTLGQSNGAAQSIFDTTYLLATDFETQADGATITGLTLNLTNVDSISHSFKVWLHSDISGSVGASLTNFSTETLVANQSGALNKLFTHDTGYSLVANTKYWVVLEMLENVANPLSGNDPTWSGNSGDGIDGGGSFLEVTSTKAMFYDSFAANWTDSIADNYLFNIIGTLSPVPEPSRVVLAIAGLFVLGFRRRR